MTRSLDEAPIASPAPILDGRYQLESLVGRGGMGTVYRALDTRLGRRVAVKVLQDAPAADEARFRAEVLTLAQLSHPYLVRLLDAGESDGKMFLVMELIEGSTLDKRLRDGPLSQDEAAALGAEIASALAYVHQQGIVHRDIKPANILLDREGGAHLADFGIARLVDKTGGTMTGIALGTPAYLAPEQVQGLAIGPAADIYALGLVLIECLTAQRAFIGTPSEIGAARLHRPPELPQGLDPEWRRTIGSMTALAPAERPTAASLRTHFANLPMAMATRPLFVDESLWPADQPGSGAPNGTQLYPAPTPAAVPPAAAPRPLAREKSPLTALLLVVLVALAVLLLLIATGAFSTGRSTGDRPPLTTLRHHSATTTVPQATSTSTSTSVPVTTTALSVGAAAGNLVTAITSGVRNGSVQPQVGQQLVNGLNPILFAPQPEPTQQAAQQLTNFATTLGQAISQGQVTPAAGTSITSALDHLATTLGLAPPQVTAPTQGTAPTPGGGKHHGHGKGGGGGDKGGGGGDN